MLKGKRILIVDDNDLNIFALSAVLKSKGPVLFKAKDGKECIDFLEKNDPVDLVLLDMMMPVMDGYETLTELRKNKRFENLPIIALTAQAMVGDSEKCLKIGASDYCSKPVDFDVLLKKICSLLQLL